MILKKLDVLIDILSQVLLLMQQTVDASKPSVINQPATLMNKQEVLTFLNISESTYKRRVKEGQLKPMRLGGGDMFYKEDLQEALWESKRRGRI